MRFDTPDTNSPHPGAPPHAGSAGMIAGRMAPDATETILNRLEAVIRESADFEAALARAESERDTYKTEHGAAEHERDEFRSERDKMKVELASVRAEYDELCRSLVVTEAARVETENEREGLRWSLIVTETARNRAEAECNENARLLKLTKVERDRARLANADLIVERNCAEAERGAARQECDALASKVSELQREVACQVEQRDNAWNMARSAIAERDESARLLKQANVVSAERGKVVAMLISNLARGWRVDAMKLYRQLTGVLMADAEKAVNSVLGRQRQAAFDASVLMDTLAKGERIGAIKAYRRLTDCSLIDAKHKVESVTFKYDIGGRRNG